MITVGVVQELNFISQAFKVPVKASIAIPLAKNPLLIEIDNNYLSLMYNNQKIWKEEIASPASMFGIESCDSILKIIYMIDNQIEDWKDFVYFEK